MHGVVLTSLAKIFLQVGQAASRVAHPKPKSARGGNGGRGGKGGRSVKSGGAAANPADGESTDGTHADEETVTVQFHRGPTSAPVRALLQFAAPEEVVVHAEDAGVSTPIVHTGSVAYGLAVPLPLLSLTPSPLEGGWTAAELCTDQVPVSVLK